VVGINTAIVSYGGASLAGLVSGNWQGPGATASQYAAVATGVDESIACLRCGIMLATLDNEPIAMMVSTGQSHQPEIILEIVANTDAIVEHVLIRLRALMDEHNVMRGKVMSFNFGRHGEFGMTFSQVPRVSRDQVVLPDAALTAIEHHAIGISAHRAELIAAGQHVKRGLLLYGPPGTGKTHTVSYLLSQMANRTTIILTGAAVGAIGQAGTIARALQPATIVIEDVDLIGMDRGLPGGEHNPMLFQMLNEMDGLSHDADVLFVLTTNRVDILEPALAARPGRVDQAVEIGLPDSAARVRLIRLYVGGDVDDETAGQIVDRTEGVAAAFIKELARRATLMSIQTGQSVAQCLEPSLKALYEQSTPILRRSLAARAE
jgi:cell division protease FtsH